MRLVFYHAAGNRASGGCLTDLTECEWWNYTRTHWYTDITIVRVIDVPEQQGKIWRAEGNIKTLFKKDLHNVAIG